MAPIEQTIVFSAAAACAAAQPGAAAAGDAKAPPQRRSWADIVGRSAKASPSPAIESQRQETKPQQELSQQPQPQQLPQ
eukprot:CAMPEP_0168488210 /NCGR_PEP_ID=MMETSP0228-20121227/68033_1 /TAXON_ID=133427 /ORGANISM="Protoceratium reticulatum, Strain CCCM 535 (=CCMP 1889)" /LENGTH=78 /DNA_ID=CAMNT_0008504849 /DNA_START=75 /DNA_END=308 /DNA_ORIENTATION=+